jgi:hypothetical protein
MAVATALIGLAGVILGVVLTGAIAYGIESRRRTKAAEVSSRLIADDFSYAKAAADGMLEKDMWVRDTVADLVTVEQWRAERASLAAKATYDDWRDVAVTARVLALIAGFHSRRRETETLSAPLRTEERDALELASRRLEGSLPILDKYAGR